MKILGTPVKRGDRTIRFRRGIPILAVFLLLISCEVWTAELPEPKHRIILTVDGKIRKTNGPGHALFDIQGLEALGLTTYTTFDPYEKRRVKYTGVLLTRLLEVLEADPAAERVQIVALDKYKVTLKVEDIRRWPILLATRMEDKEMPVLKKGPTKIVFPYDSHPEIDPSKYNPLWIWQVKTMTVK